jgi:hypothetical protein
MKKVLAILAVLLVLLVGCASQKSPDIVCSSPYLRHGADCCMDRNSNSICDDDEEEDILFVEPDYAPSEDVPGISDDIEDMPVYIPSSGEEQEEEVTVTETPGQGAKDAVKSMPTQYTAPEVKLTGWVAENDYMRMEITKIVIDVNDITPIDLRSPDKEAYLKEMYLTVKNKDYSYINPVFHFRVGDSKDPIIITENLVCGEADDIKMEGCRNLPEAETMQIRMVIDRNIPRLELDKTIKLVLENKRDTDEDNFLVLERTKDILDIFGAKYI